MCSPRFGRWPNAGARLIGGGGEYLPAVIGTADEFGRQALCRSGVGVGVWQLSVGAITTPMGRAQTRISISASSIEEGRVVGGVAADRASPRFP